MAERMVDRQSKQNLLVVFQIEQIRQQEREVDADDGVRVVCLEIRAVLGEHARADVGVLVAEENERLECEQAAGLEVAHWVSALPARVLPYDRGTRELRGAVGELHGPKLSEDVDVGVVLLAERRLQSLRQVRQVRLAHLRQRDGGGTGQERVDGRRRKLPEGTCTFCHRMKRRS